MAYTYNIDKDKPPDTGESPSLGAQRIRYFKEAIIERLKNWVYGFLSDSETDEGLKKAPLKTGTAPTQQADKIIVYAKDVNNIAELFARDENGNEIQITSAGQIKHTQDTRLDYGNYTGNAASSRDIATAFTPKAVFLIDSSDHGLFVKFAGMPTSYAVSLFDGNFKYHTNFIVLGTNKFTVFDTEPTPSTNQDNNDYYWIALDSTD